KPKVVEQVNTSPPAQTANVHDNVNLDPSTSNHKVVVQETLEASRYTYMHVAENGSTYWMAVPKQDIEVGATYYYTGGLKKANFKSEEHDRVFETIYLVGQVSRAPSEAATSALERAQQQLGTNGGSEEHVHVEASEGTVSLKELFANRAKYAGKVIKVRGKCVKVNNNIMGTNWVHIQDGSDAANELDLTVTTKAHVAVGAVVEAEGKITLDKDFGAGYFYDIIMEDAHVHVQ
ncbi:MAG: GW dipeptide domain-containing protein, partial [Saprospiraceae bacterium]|nr:GW dipeptide domain-containing protein [Saprospiraceae bacterium]